MAKRFTDQPRCHYCHKFISWEQSNRSFHWIQNPHTFDPDPYEAFNCTNCEPSARLSMGLRDANKTPTRSNR